MAARRNPTGLTSPRVENAELQRFLNQVSQRVEGLSREIGTSLGDRTTGGGTASGGVGPSPTPSGGGFLPTIPVLDTPPQPVGVEVFCGIGICIVSWENPYRFYSNHARALIYRGTTDRFDESVQIGQAEYFVFVDETSLEDNTLYYYWVRFVSTTDVEGPLSDVASGTTGLDPEAVYDDLVAWLESSPLAAALASDILNPAFVLEEIRRMAAAVSLIAASAADAADDAAEAAKTAADTAQDSADDAQTTADAARALATSAKTIADAAAAAAAAAASAAAAAQTTADEANTAAAAAEAAADAAETAADEAETQAAAAETLANEAKTIADGAKTAADEAKTEADSATSIANNAANAANNAAAQALTAFNNANTAQVSANEALVQAADLLDDIGTLERADELVVYITGQNRSDRFNAAFVEGGTVEIGIHATDTTDDVTVEVYSKTDTDQGPGSGNSHLYELLLEPDLVDWTTGTIYIRNTGAAFDLTQARLQNDVDDVNADERWLIDEDVARFPVVTQIDAINTTLAGKADASAVTALDARITTNANGISTHTAQITSLEARLVSTSLGPEQNEFTGTDRATAEAARDTYFADNPTKLNQYNADTNLNIRLTWGVLRVFQHRVGDGETPETFSWSDNGEVEPTAAAISTLNATVVQQGTAIETNTASITALTTTVGTKADASALASKADATAVTALQNRITTNENSIETNQSNVALLEALLDGLQLGPQQNTFVGADRDAAETARDNYFVTETDKLTEYENDDELHIRLRWGDDNTTVYQNRPTRQLSQLVLRVSNAQATEILANNDVGGVVTVALRDTDLNVTEVDLTLALNATAAANTGGSGMLATFTFWDETFDWNSDDIWRFYWSDGTDRTQFRLRTATLKNNIDPPFTAGQWFPRLRYQSINRWTDVPADPRAGASALSGLSNRITANANGITAVQSDVTALTTTVGTKADATALTTLANRVSANETSITTNQSSITTLTTSVGTKADTSTVTALTSRVATNETDITTVQGQITTLNTTVSNLATTSSISALTTRVSANETNITTIQGDITTLTSSLNSKANTTALTALTNRVTEAESDIAVDQANIAMLEAAVDGIALGPVPNTFRGDDRTAAETARDTYFSANPDDLAPYNDDTELHIRLQWGDNNQYQNRAMNAWADVAATSFATASALTTLANRVTVNETGISTNQTNITNLTTTVGTKADTTALTALTNRVSTTETDIDTAEGDITTIQGNITTLTASLAGKADTTALTALANRVTTTENEIEVEQSNIASLEAALDNVTLGPEQNTFTGDNEANAQNARDTYFTANPDNLTLYNDDTSLSIRLQYGTDTKYQRRSNNGRRWVDVTADPFATASALQVVSNNVTANDDDITTIQGNITTLTTTVGTKADTSTVTALTNRVTANETSITTNQSNITTLTSSVAGKADQSAVDAKADTSVVTALTSRVTANETSITTNTANITSLTTTVGTKADTTALTALTSRVTATETDIAVEQANVASLEASLDGLTLGPEQNTFTGADEDAAEAARDTYFTANTDNLAIYNDDTALNIRLQYGTTTKYQRRSNNGSRWVNVTADPLAKTSALTTLSNTVTSNSDSITTIQSDVTSLTTTVGTKADSSALDTKADTSAVTALTNRVSANEDNIETHTAQITSLEARLTAQNLGPEQNEFTGGTRAEAETARDTYAAANATWLNQYNADSNLNIRLTWNSGALRVFQNRIGDGETPETFSWEDNGEVEATAAAVTTLSAAVTRNTTAIAANTANITTLTTTVGTKADTSTVTALTNRVKANETSITTNQSNITTLTATVGTKADQSALDLKANTTALTALTNRVSANETAITTNQTNITSLMTTVGTKADTTAVTALTTRVSANETAITTNAANITSLNTTVAGKADASALTTLQTEIDANEAAITANSTAITNLNAAVSIFEPGMEQNVFVGADRAAAENARDTYRRNNNAWWRDYRDNENNYILLEFD